MPWRGAFGLRGRIVGAVIVTTVATLVVAALALLGPLEHKLRTAALTTLRSELRGGPANQLKSLDLQFILAAAFDERSDPGHLLGLDEQKDLQAAQAALAQQTGATAFVTGYPNANGENARVLAPPADVDAMIQDPHGLVAAAYRTQRSAFSIESLNGNEYATAVIPFAKTYPKSANPKALSPAPEYVRYVLVVRKPIDEIAAAVSSIRTAFLDAALAGLALTLVLAIPLAFTIVRRLRRLRQAALQLGRGGPAVDIPTDRARDEVGDLARAFALMQTQLQQQEEARRAFVATASHELRTPLTSLEGMLELLQDELAGHDPDIEDARSLLGRARAQSHRLGRLAADLLDLSRIDAQVALRSEPVELGELSRAVMAEFELGTSERGISSELHDEQHPVWALGDPGSVARILRILLDNAVRVSPRGSEIVVELEGGSRAQLAVCDEGPGVLESERELIFQRFHRGRDTGGQAGFGLGLAIGRELAERMGGELVLEDGERRGAKFILRLPAATAPDHDSLAVA